MVRGKMKVKMKVKVKFEVPFFLSTLTFMGCYNFITSKHNIISNLMQSS